MDVVTLMKRRIIYWLMLTVRFHSRSSTVMLIGCSVLRLLCTNSHGLFWAGDTAQTIAIGSSFRFNDLKSFLHRIEVGQHDNVKFIAVII